MVYGTIESKSLTGSNIKDEKWYRKLLRRQYKKIISCILLLIVIYVLFYFINASIQPHSNETNKEITKTRNPLHIPSIAKTNNEYLEQCAPQVKCNPNSKYRSINGSCNNLEIPTWGASNTAFLRLLDACYSDGHFNIRVQTDGSPLPNVRLLNIKLFLGREKYHEDENNALLMPFGQLIAHDLTGMPTDALVSPDGVVTDCCLDEVARKTMPQCKASFDHPPDDPVYVEHGVRCQSRYRYQTSANFSCPLYPTQYLNVNTQFLDASEVYGSTDSDARRLRLMEGGLLNFSRGDGGQVFCPYQSETSGLPEELRYIKFHYDAGDSASVNQNIGITTMTTLYLRFHNYIAFRLSYLNPFWSDETLYQESRRIVIGIIQRTVYEDFLPIIIGEDFQDLYGLNEENIYDPTVNPSVSQEWTSAAYRVLHTLIPVKFNFVNHEYKIEDSMVITDWMSNPDMLPINNNFDKLLKGFLETAGRAPQSSYNFYVSNYMFHPHFQPGYMGFDLLSGDILAGRDVGLQPYNQVRQFCGLPLAKDFDDLVDYIHIRDINLLKEYYHTVNDIDLLVGLLLEKISDGAMVGPTTRCIIADSFFRIKVGDRFFYDVQGQPGSFTPDQLKQIKKITLGHVICASTNVDHVQKDIFKLVDHNLFSTSKLKCDEEFYIDLNAWRDTTHRTEM